MNPHRHTSSLDLSRSQQRRSRTGLLIGIIATATLLLGGVGAAALLLQSDEDGNSEEKSDQHTSSKNSASSPEDAAEISYTALGASDEELIRSVICTQDLEGGSKFGPPYTSDDSSMVVDIQHTVKDSQKAEFAGYAESYRVSVHVVGTATYGDQPIGIDEIDKLPVVKEDQRGYVVCYSAVPEGDADTSKPRHA